ncbi:hypothetical protein PR202_ga18618 [Eleusine coracana subsp. coracana]|uniref:Uncharacterized protein n=1 Tax=Eleusine coracana subsp. coracana TaxID=191504 RepID=A0AAV5CTG6_ELECO|nr:hypothetical protein PR202_ga18618 [Eleusine coracana subsp. coracana]
MLGFGVRWGLGSPGYCPGKASIGSSSGAGNARLPLELSCTAPEVDFPLAFVLEFVGFAELLACWKSVV